MCVCVHMCVCVRARTLLPKVGQPLLRIDGAAEGTDELRGTQRTFVGEALAEGTAVGHVGRACQCACVYVCV